MTLKRAQVRQYYLRKCDVQIPVLKEYVDNNTICAASESNAQLLLNEVNDFMNWSKMRIKPAKSRSLVMKRGKLIREEPFQENGQQIPRVQNKPVKFLGRVINGDLNDKQAHEDIEELLQHWLWKLATSVRAGVMKCWIYQHVIVPKLQWQLMIYDVPLSHVEWMEIVVAKSRRKWMGVSSDLTKVALFCHQSKLQPALEGLTLVKKKLWVNATSTEHRWYGHSD